MNRAINTLKHEHEAIMLSLKILTRMDQRVSAEQITDIQDLSTMTDFLKAFADTCHHGKEEGILLPAMKAQDLAQTEHPIQRMLHEHAESRRHLADMQAALHPEVNLIEFHEAARAYTALLLAPMEKENTILFPMAERLFSNEKQTELAQAFDAYEDKVMGPGQHDPLHASLKKMLAKYPARACVLRSAFCVLRSAFCVLRSAFCVLRSAFCVLRQVASRSVRPCYNTDKACWRAACQSGPCRG